VIEYLENGDYDKLLTENVVFINLVDASAVNTVVECMVRNTPFVVNRHPAVVELLGEDYPLYFDFDGSDYSSFSLAIRHLLKNTVYVKKAHNYLKKLDKNKISMHFFVNHFVDTIKNIRGL
jgi:hypothetical protein